MLSLTFLSLRGTNYTNMPHAYLNETWGSYKATIKTFKFDVSRD